MESLALANSVKQESTAFKPCECQWYAKNTNQTLYEYFGLSNRFAESGVNDIKKQLTKKIMKDQECWYVKVTLGEGDNAAHNVV